VCVYVCVAHVRDRSGQVAQSEAAAAAGAVPALGTSARRSGQVRLG
jgi:hypothetical protein